MSLLNRPSLNGEGRTRKEVDIIGRRKIWYVLSLAVLVPGLILLGIWGLRLGIDFTGGTVVHVDSQLSQSDINDIVSEAGVDEPEITGAGDGGYQIRFNQDVEIEPVLNQAENVEVNRLERVGPSVSRDLVINALLSLAIVSLAITLYVMFAFRKVEYPLRFGTIAIVALLHDALFVLAAFALFGRLFNVEVDSFIVTAVLTVIGFSVHDTIVVLDRIRENLLRKSGEFADIINTSVNEVMGRSLNTSITTILVLLALFLLGGSSTSNFILALLLGMLSGTYSSIFIASPLLVSWSNLRKKKARN